MLRVGSTLDHDSILSMVHIATPGSKRYKIIDDLPMTVRPNRPMDIPDIIILASNGHPKPSEPNPSEPPHIESTHSATSMTFEPSRPSRSTSKSQLQRRQLQARRLIHSRQSQNDHDQATRALVRNLINSPQASLAVNHDAQDAQEDQDMSRHVIRGWQELRAGAVRSEDGQLDLPGRAILAALGWDAKGFEDETHEDGDQ